MSIDNILLKKESQKLISNIKRGSRLAKTKHYEEAVAAFEDAIISAGLILQKDKEVSKDFKCDKMILALKGLQLKAYAEKIEKENPENTEELQEKMAKIAQGPINRNNPYLIEIIRAMDECEYLLE
ncbi:hypothetical protein HYX16_04040 [Candidatus Woesearchaeota archaeon]|nr:hypothetical protein [Candidatus Woesearchaeota archaeon]